MINETIELRGLSFRVELEHDGSGEAPWDREDGHGPVSEWRNHGDDSRGARKRPGERELCDDGRSFGQTRFYDMREAIKIAHRDGWGLSDEQHAALNAKLGREASVGEVRAAAVEADFQRLRAWCRDDWEYVGVIVTLLDTDGNPTNETASIWGIESDAGEYLDETARELAEEIAGRVGKRRKLTTSRRIRKPYTLPRMYHGVIIHVNAGPGKLRYSALGIGAADTLAGIRALIRTKA